MHGKASNIFEKQSTTVDVFRQKRSGSTFTVHSVIRRETRLLKCASYELTFSFKSIGYIINFVFVMTVACRITVGLVKTSRHCIVVGANWIF